MRGFPNLQQLVGEIPWGQNIAIMTKVKDITAREYYMNMTSQMGWGHNVLLNQIKTGKLPDAKQIEAGILREIEVDQKVE
jgi:predicted nuclease of restriction endonuclease-like (RecB) superfamily